MKRAILILLAGVILGAAAYACLYLAGSASRRDLALSKAPELLWLKQEFDLSDSEFQRISQLHEAYLPNCAAMCARIESSQSALKELVARTNALTAEIEGKLAETSQLRLECQTMMLRHFYDVSRTMRPDQGKRYLAWVQEKTFLPDHGMADTSEQGRTHEHATGR